MESWLDGCGSLPQVPTVQKQACNVVMIAATRTLEGGASTSLQQDAQPFHTCQGALVPDSWSLMQCI